MPQLDRLLVIEDDANHREGLSQRLILRGYQVDVAGDGADALEKIGRAEYDLVLLGPTLFDVTVSGPERPGARSLDLLRLLRATHSATDLPVIMLTDGERNGTVVEALHGGANDYVVMPVDLPVMTARIDEQLSRSRIGRQRKSTRRNKAHPQRHDEGRWKWDLASNTIQFSARSRAFLGLGREEIGSHPEEWLARIHPADVERVRAEIRALLDGHTPEYRSEHRVRNHQGRYEWLLAHGWMEHSEDGTASRVCGTLAARLRPDVDALTGLGTRVLILERLGASMARHTAGSVALMLLDLDGFSLINDSFGQSTGDRILTEIAGRLQSTLADRQPGAAAQAACSLARIGGDEFAILAEGVTRENAGALVESILHTAVRPMTVDGFKISVAASIGVFCGFPEGSAPEDLLRDAYLAMYRAKELGKNRWHLFEPELRTRARTRIATVHDLRYAVEREQLRAYYQPKVHLKTRQITGFEALIRWHHPARGIVYPGEFIELAEDAGLIVPIGEWMLREACGQLQRWQARFALPTPLTMNVNLSVKQLVDPNLVEHVKTILEETGIVPSTLNLELTETALMTNLDGAKSALTDLRKLGVRLKLDDFGTGYSSLGYLGALHFDSLKIDRGFVQRMASDSESHTIVESIAKLAHALGMTLVAEGIELEEHIVELLRMGCEVGQGFYFSTAVEASAAEELIEGSLKGPVFQQSRFREGLC